MLTRLPPEILREIIVFVTEVQPNSFLLLRVNSTLRQITTPILYQNLVFPSTEKLQRFIDRCTELSLTHVPRTIALELTSSDYLTPFVKMKQLFTVLASHSQAEVDTQGSLAFESIRLRLNSFSRSDNSVYEALSMTNPQAFCWTGPDPPHHFSIAIVQPALLDLLHAMGSFTNLRFLKLTNFAAMKSFPSLPSLRTIYFGQVVFLNPAVIVDIVLNHIHVELLTSLRLVDAYQDSIWGPRVRGSDIENAAIQRMVPGRSLLPGPPLAELTFEEEKLVWDTLQRIRAVVTCDGLTERIIGGDRASDAAPSF